MPHFWPWAAGFGLVLMMIAPSSAGDDLIASEAGWDRTALVADLTTLAGNLSRLEEMVLSPEIEAKNPKAPEILANQSKRLNPGDHIWFLTSGSLGLTITMAGSDTRIHTVNIYAPVVNFSEAQAAAMKTFNADLFKRMFPDWPEGATWMTDALGRTWNIMSKNWGSHDPTIMETFVDRHSVGPVRLSTTGVPPDIQIYRLTVRPVCEIDIQQEDLFQRWVC